MNTFAKVCKSGPIGSEACSTKTSDSAGNQFSCEVCEKSYKEKKSLTKHVKEKHSQGESESFTCNKCSLEFSSQTGLNEHRGRKRGKEKARFGCLYPKSDRASSRSQGSRSSKGSRSIKGSRSTSRNIEFDDVDDVLDQAAEEQARGFTRFLFDPNDKSFQQFAQELMAAGESSLQEPRLEFHVGLIQALVSGLASHPDWVTVDSEKPPGVKNIMEKRQKREKLVREVMVKPDQSNAVKKHLDDATYCDKNCNWVICRAMLHKQQVLLGFELLKLSTVGRQQISKKLLTDHIMGHLRLVNRNDHQSNTRELFDLLRRNFATCQVVLEGIEDCQQSLVGDQFNLPPLTRPEETSASGVRAKSRPPPLEVSIATLERMEERVARRDKSRPPPASEATLLPTGLNPAVPPVVPPTSQTVRLPRVPGLQVIEVRSQPRKVKSREQDSGKEEGEEVEVDSRKSKLIARMTGSH